MERPSGIWNNERELANFLVGWALLWNILFWSVISPLLIERPGPPAFYAFDLGIGTLVWATIMAACLVPSLTIFSRVRKLRATGRATTR